MLHIIKIGLIAISYVVKWRALWNSNFFSELANYLNYLIYLNGRET